MSPTEVACHETTQWARGGAAGWLARFRIIYKGVVKEDLREIAIVGGGIVGLATALALRERGAESLVILEAEPELASHQTGHNSGVIHSGLYYEPGSLKARNCVQGRELLYAFCEENDVPHERCGKLVVATSEEELARLD